MIGLENAPRYAELVRRHWGAEDFVPPGFILASDRPEWKYLARVRLFSSGFQSVAANAANVSQVEASYPLLGGTQAQGRMIAVITFVMVSGLNVAASGERYDLTMQGSVATTPTTGATTDGRTISPINGATAGTVLQWNIANSNPSVSGTIIDEVTSTAASQDLIFHIPPIVLVQETASAGFKNRLTVFSVSINKALRTFWFGYEWLAEPEEFDA